jgi:hypothetical protein
MMTSPRLRFPSRREWQNILHDFALMPTQAKTLKTALEEALDAISHYQEKRQNQPSRSDLVKGLKNFEKALRCLRDEGRRSADLMEYFLPDGTLAFIGQSLTFSAISEALGRDVSPKAFDFYFQIRLKQSQGERLTVASLEQDMRPKRETLGLQHGHMLLMYFIERIHQPLARWIEMKSLDRGGRPANIARNYLIYQLAEAAPEVIGKPATVATTGKFVNLCTTVLVACGLPEAGIEKAIPPVVRKLRPNQAKWRKRAAP